MIILIIRAKSPRNFLSLNPLVQVCIPDNITTSDPAGINVRIQGSNSVLKKIFFLQRLLSRGLYYLLYTPVNSLWKIGYVKV